MKSARKLRVVPDCPQPDPQPFKPIIYCQQYCLDVEEARRVLDYDPETGVFQWKVSTGPNARVGEIAGYIPTVGYRYIQVNGRAYRACRLAFLIMTGQWPSNEVDHIDRNRINDRWSNLRDCSCAENSQNRGLRSDNTSGVPGVNWHTPTQKWYARIGLNGKRYHLGSFDSLEEATIVYQAAKSRLHPYSIKEDEV